MPLQIASLNSGSNANCYYIGNGKEAILVDAGLSCREMERRMAKLGLEMGLVKALFVSHEHSDHISGVTGLARKYRFPVYITEATLQCARLPLEVSQTFHFRHASPVKIGDLEILPFKKSHDAADPHSFLVSGSGVNVGVMTDIGYACKKVLKYFSQCHAVFLEANYCEDMLENGNYPYHLKQRIRGDEGHLSNAQALELFRHYRSAELQLLVLSHLSKNNNKPELVEKLFVPYAADTKIVIASRYEASRVFEISSKKKKILVLRKGSKPQRQGPPNEQQLSLF